MTARHRPGDLLGHTKHGKPIYLAAGGDGTGEPPAGPPTEPPADPDGSTPPADPPKGDETDWKAEARKHEKRAKENAKAAEELEKLKRKHMSDQEKAVAEAEAKGKTEATKTFGARLAAAEFKSAAIDAGVSKDTLAGLGELISFDKFVDDSGEVDTKAIEKAVKALPKAGKAGGGKSGGDFGGSPGGPPASLRAQLDAAEKAGNHMQVIHIKRLMAAGQT